MKQVFVDTLYWIASINPGDQWHKTALQTVSTLGYVQFITTEEVLVEVLSTCAGYGSHLRHRAANTVQLITASVDVTVVHQTHQTFMAGLDLYKRRVDKAYSMVDCISMNTMRQMGITDILTNDHHFTQEGFTVLIKG